MVPFKQMMGLLLLKTGQEIVLGQVFAPLLNLMTKQQATVSLIHLNFLQL